MALTKEEIIKGIRGSTNMSLNESWKIAIGWAKTNCLTMREQYAFLTELYTPQQIEMLTSED